MAMVGVWPREVSVTWDRRTGRPRSIGIGGEQLEVVAVERVRREVAAHPVGTGPRTLFIVRTPVSRLRLAFGHRARRWVMDGVDARPVSRDRVA